MPEVESGEPCDGWIVRPNHGESLVDASAIFSSQIQNRHAAHEESKSESESLLVAVETSISSVMARCRFVRAAQVRDFSACS